jgi:hypothetical protein
MVWWMLRDELNAMVLSLLAGRPAPMVDSSETAVITPPELPQPKKEDPFDIDIDLGDWNGTGHSIAKADGNQPLAGRKAEQDQPLLSRDPVGHGRIGDAPTQYTGPIGNGGQAIEHLRETVEDQDTGQQAVAMKFPVEAPVVTKPTPKPVAGPDNAPPPQVASGPTVVASGGGGATPQKAQDAPNKSADPAPMSDSEIDLFSRNAVVEFRQGKAVPQFGRKATLTRPRIPLAGAIDAFAMGRAVRITLVLKTDEKGQVVNARVARGSGSNEIDNPVRREAYNWTFDPGDKDHPFPSEFPIVVAIYD